MFFGVHKFPYSWFSTLMQSIAYALFSVIQYIVRYKKFPSFLEPYVQLLSDTFIEQT